MEMKLQHNITAMNTNRQFGITGVAANKNMEKLASGYRINRAADDAAGLAISEKMRSQIRGLAMGTRNTEEGISLCHVADGALNEVHAMMNRLKEISVQAANGTNCESDRNMIQDEVEQILEEVDRIGNDTEFNTMPIFKGSTETMVTDVGEYATLGDIPFSDFVLTDVRLNKPPLQEGTNPNILNLAAIVNNSESIYDGNPVPLLYENGSTSNSSIRITVGGVSSVVNLNGFNSGANSNWTISENDYKTNGTDSWTKEYLISDGTTEIGMIQSIKVEDTSGTEKNYVISYEFSPTNDVDKLEFLFHVDTAYNGTNEGDYEEGYYIEGKRLENISVYDKGTDLVGASTSQYLYNETPPSSFSIINIEKALAFSEKISFQSGKEPDVLSIGIWSLVDEWDYYNNLDSYLGGTTKKQDLGFSLYYDLPSGNSTVSFNYGIVSTEADSNIHGVDIKKDTTTISEHSKTLDIWIQSGPNEGEGMYLTIGEMNAEVLGIRSLDVSTYDGAQKALTAVDIASQKVSSIRSIIGAQQNRLEHTVLYNENTLENTTAAESRIRDADMAEAMVANAKYNILMQTSQAMLSQANNMTEGILQLLNA